jgi:hypothetical protein
MNTPERIAAWYSDTEVGDTHYDLDVKTGKITFHRDNAQFKAEKAAFQAHGVDIDQISDEATYDMYWMKFKETIYQVIKARALNRKDNCLEARLVKAIYSDDDAEADRLSELLKKRNQLNLRTV